MKGLLLAVSLAVLIDISVAVEVCGSKGRGCIEGQALCVDGKCVCQPPNTWGDGAFGCYAPNTVAAQVSSDPKLQNFNNESINFPYPCRYLATHLLTELRNQDNLQVGTCEIMIHSFNAKYRGKFFLHGFDVALNIRYTSGGTVKLSSRHYGIAKSGVYTFKNQGTVGEFYQNGPWGNDDIDYNDYINNVHVTVSKDESNNQLLYQAERCGLRISFVPYDVQDRRAQLSIPGLSIAINTDNHPKWMSKGEVMALAPKDQNGDLFADTVITGFSVEESVFIRAFENEYVQNMPLDDKGKCYATHKAFMKCTRPELRQAIKNCFWMMKKSRFIFCMDKSQSSRKILKLFATCMKVWCATTPCSKAQDLIVKAGCDTIRDIPQVTAFMKGEMCPPVPV
ncbi:hypothetical protein EGW08_008092 [Elysia chlorotica]|uniref:VWFD domain-containing protein n=1 Tax=Elysia chlorotica TaxID=188477 RepID=A0A3S0ZVQ0_ELYCH|nr:hypothetical protein EGW08_008092 [Elysia chlorotica]